MDTPIPDLAAAGFVDSARTSTDNSLQAQRVEREINANRNPPEHIHEAVLVRDSSPQP
jgi:hypothetical protein